MLHTIQANDVIPIILIPILPPAVDWVATATCSPRILGMLPVSHAWWHYNVSNWVSHLSIDHFGD